MNKLILAAAFFCSAPCFADNYLVPYGFYTGTGTWTDNLGASGTWSMTLSLTNISTGGQEEFTAQFDDGREYSGTSAIVFGQNSNFSYIVNVGGQSVTIGQGVSGPGHYQVMNLALNQNESIMEFGDFSQAGILKRSGRMFDASTGRATFFEITETRHQ